MLCFQPDEISFTDLSEVVCDLEPKINIIYSGELRMYEFGISRFALASISVSR